MSADVPPVSQGARYRSRIRARSFAASIALCGAFVAGCVSAPPSLPVPAGEVVDRFQLDDGRHVVLLRDQNRYVLKVGANRIADFPHAFTARIADVRQIGFANNVLIETRERDCARRYRLYSVQTQQVLNWSLGDCRTPAQISADGQRQKFVFPAGRIEHVFEYHDNRLFAVTRPVLAPGLSAATRSSAQPAPSSTHDEGAAGSSTTQPSSGSPPASAPAVRSASGSLPPPPSDMKFPKTERRPVIIDLRE